MTKPLKTKNSGMPYVLTSSPLKLRTVSVSLKFTSQLQACEYRMQNAARKRSPCSAFNWCELSPTWLMPVSFASSAAPAVDGESATGAPGTGFDVMSSIVSAPSASDRRDSIGGGTGAQLQCTRPRESI